MDWKSLIDGDEVLRFIVRLVPDAAESLTRTANVHSPKRRATDVEAVATRFLQVVDGDLQGDNTHQDVPHALQRVVEKSSSDVCGVQIRHQILVGVILSRIDRQSRLHTLKTRICNHGQSTSAEPFLVSRTFNVPNAEPVTPNASFVRIEEDVTASGLEAFDPLACHANKPKSLGEHGKRFPRKKAVPLTSNQTLFPEATTIDVPTSNNNPVALFDPFALH